MHEIADLMSRHEWYYSAGQHQREIDELFTHRQPDVSFGTNAGMWVGLASIQRSYVGWFITQSSKDLAALSRRHPEIANVPANRLSGTSMMHTLTTPLIVVADDGKTAKGMWYTIGQVTQTPLGQPDTNVMYERYAIDFIRDPEGWRIWHFNVFTDVTSAPDSDWTHPKPGVTIVRQPGEVLPWEDPAAPKFDVAGPLYEKWSVHSIRGEKPKIPVPYRTFSETFSYGPPASATASRLAPH